MNQGQTVRPGAIRPDQPPKRPLTTKYGIFTLRYKMNNLLHKLYSINYNRYSIEYHGGQTADYLLSKG